MSTTERSLDLAGEVDGLDDAARRAVAVGGVAVDIGREVPDAGAEAKLAHDVSPLLRSVGRTL